MDKKTVEIIFAEAVVQVWKERLQANQCSYAEFEDAMIKNINLTKDEVRDNGD